MHLSGNTSSFLSNTQISSGSQNFHTQSSANSISATPYFDYSKILADYAYNLISKLEAQGLETTTETDVNANNESNELQTPEDNKSIKLEINYLFTKK